MQSPYKSEFLFGKGGNIMPFSEQKSHIFADSKFNPNIIHSSFNLLAQSLISNTSNYSYTLLKNLQLTGKFQNRLKEGIEVSQDFIDNDVNLMGISDVKDSWMSNMKSFISQNLINQILSDHEENIDHLNNILEPALGITISTEVIESRDYDNFTKEISRLIKDSTLNFSKKREIGENLNSYKIFFGDNDKLQVILDKIAEKLKMLKIQKEKSKIHIKDERDNVDNLGKTLFSHIKKENIDPRAGMFSGNLPIAPVDRKSKVNNPMINKNRFDKMSNYAEMLEIHNKSIEDNLIMLKNLILERLETNKFLDQVFMKAESYDHKQLIL
jgi:hypothetical protein